MLVVMMADMSGRSSSVAALLAMLVVMMAMLIIQTHCFSINQTITVSCSASCDGLNDDLSCLVGQTDLDSDEFMLDSEFSRRILQATSGKSTYKSLNPGNAASCDRAKYPGCNPGENQKPPPPHCKVAPTNKDCWKHD
ncbi:hypothetical protein M0R45_025027 [Rubus argutus]|uniref:Uncharacterized protein n=1 Tax=Rubus argutus TaxID=59490 RepID=A0AAW1WUU6_RUBAR